LRVIGAGWVGGRLGAAAVPGLGVAVVLAGFEVAPRVGLLPHSSFPPTSEVLGAVVDLLGTSELWTTVGATLGAWAWAMAIAAVVAVPFGLLVGSNRLVRLLCRATIEFLRPIPSIALVPVLILVYGTETSLTVTLGAFAAGFPLLFQAMYGVADVDPVAKDMSRAYGLGRFARVRYVTVPSCAPYLATGLRISASVALILVVTGEYVAGVPGLGQKVFVAQSGGAYDRAYAWILVAGLLGLLVNLGFQGLERRYLWWHPSRRDRPGGPADHARREPAAVQL
jgi:ABC-type nitrate/sulfonate/bicarbonate transport system permease component